MSQITPQDYEQEEATEFTVLRYGVAVFVAICVGAAFFLLKKSPNKMNLDLPLWKEVVTIILSFICGYIGFIVGDFLRRWVMPSHFIANDFASLVKMKLFWKIGPQLAGMAMGGAIPLFILFGMFDDLLK